MVLLNFVRLTVRTLQTNIQTINSNSRTYVRWVSRRPVAIVNEDEVFDCEDTTTEAAVKSPKVSPKKSKKLKPPVKSERTDENEQRKTSRFTILKDNDINLTSLMTNVRSRKRREKFNEIVLEGQRLIKEGLKAGVQPKIILFNNPSDIDNLDLPDDVKLYKVPYKTIQLWSSLTSSPGLIGIFNTPDVSNNEPDPHGIPLTIICDNIREPGNLGSILRAAAGVGCEKLILLKGCVDLWEPKVLRSAAGAHFQIPIHAFPTWDEVPSLIDENAHLFVADSNFGDEFLSEYSPDELQTAINMFNLDPDDIKAKFSMNNDETNARSRPIIPTNKRTMKQFLLNLPIVPYYALDYTKNESVLILSGETEGLSYDSYKLLSEQKGIRINIPLANKVDSLNTGVALGIVTFEIKRQFLKHQSEI